MANAVIVTTQLPKAQAKALLEALREQSAFFKVVVASTV
ncbi:hypothetical protein BV326_03619 [Pseudomonas syringae pv. actinidiae]|nr:hypothetical protein BV326_03619 [Pseudomonas syringae pv. actinidiae]